MTIRTAKNRLFRPDARTGAEKAWEMRPGFFGLSGDWRIMFCLDGVEFSFVFFLLPIQEIYVLSVSPDFHYAELFWEEKHPFRRPLREKKEALPKAAEALREETGCFTRTSRRFTPNTGTFYAECPGTLSLPEGLLEGVSVYIR